MGISFYQPTEKKHVASLSVNTCDYPKLAAGASTWQQWYMWWWLQGLESCKFYTVDVKVISCYNISAGRQINTSAHKYKKDM